VANKEGELSVSRQRLLLFGDDAAFPNQSGGSSNVPQTALWSLREANTGYPPLFTFWSLLLLFCDPTFNGAHLHKISKDLLDQMCSGGLWSCASSFEFTMEPS
jgi:hypothetical protein